ncbi:MAG: TatD family hydrolase [Acidobacteria bacterium]|nr:TatD family hydrolase [Acidobacteriota bacterium]
MSARLIDSHCHLDSEQFDADRDAVLGRALEGGVEHILVIGTGGGPPDLEAGIRLAEKYAPVYATVGVHPHDAGKAGPHTVAALEALLKHPKVLAIGEIGLDYHYNFSPPEKQREVFLAQLDLACRAGKPIVIHTRQAWEDTFRLLEQHWRGAPQGGIMHCFSGGVTEARRALAMGLFLSFAGILTFPKATDVHAAAREAPADRILVETDAPYLAPAPHRGKRNEPAFVTHTARRLAELRGVDLDTVARDTSNNFRRLCLPAAPPNG